MAGFDETINVDIEGRVNFKEDKSIDKTTNKIQDLTNLLGNTETRASKAGKTISNSFSATESAIKSASDKVGALQKQLSALGKQQQDLIKKSLELQKQFEAKQRKRSSSLSENSGKRLLLTDNAGISKLQREMQESIAEMSRVPASMLIGKRNKTQIKSNLALGYDPEATKRWNEQRQSEEEKLAKIAEANRKIAEKTETAAKRILDAKLKQAEEEEKAAKKSKSKGLTENQRERNERAKERNANSAQRNQTAAAHEARRQRESDELANYRAYKNAHPEEFGSIRRSRRYQGAAMISSATSAFADRGVMGRGVSDIGTVATGAMLAGPWGAAAAAVGVLVKNIADLSKACEESYANIESLKTQLSVVFGGYTQSSQMYTDIARYATKSPFGIEQTTELATLLRQSGVEATKVMDTLKMLGDTATGDMEKMKRIANNYAQIVSIGKASMLDMRQFAYAGIPIFEAISKELGVSQTKLRKLISDGKVTAEIVEKVFKDMTGVNGIFENATKKGAETLKARKQNLEDIKTLAKASVGESLTRLGESDTRQSFKMWNLSFAEKLYQGINDVAVFQNILKSVDNIEKAQYDLPKLEKERKDLLRGREVTDLSANELRQLKIIDQKITNIKKWTEDKDFIRDTLATQYEYFKEGGIADIYKKRDIAEKTLTGVGAGLGYANSIISILGHNNPIADSISNEVYRSIRADELSKYDTIIDNFEDLQLKYNEKQIILSQSSAGDLVSEGNKRSTSYMNAANEILSELESTDAYKKKEEEERKKRLEKIWQELKDINKNTRPGGYIDFSKTSGKRLDELIQSGAISNTRALALNTDNLDSFINDVPVFMSQLSSRIGEIKEEVGYTASTREIIQPLVDLLSPENMVAGQHLNNLTAQGFSDQISTAWGEYEKRAEAYLNDSKAVPSVKRFITGTLQNWVSQSLLGYTPVSAPDGSMSDLNDKSRIPLWKRILGNNLGISPLAVTGTTSALDFYQNNVQARRTAGNVVGTALKEGSMSVGQLQRLLSPSLGRIQNWGDTDKVWQIDWQAVSKNIKDFAMSVQSSTAVLNAYKSSLEEERDTLVNVLTASFTTGETESTNARIITAEQLASGKHILSQDDAGVNAFGEALYNEEGQLVASMKDGVAYDAQGVELANQNLVITGKIYEEIKKRLNEKEKELDEAKIVSIYKSMKEADDNEELNSELKKRLKGYANTAGQLDYIDSNYDSYKKQIESAIDLDLRTRIANNTAYRSENPIFKALLDNHNLSADQILKMWSSGDTSSVWSQMSDKEKQSFADYKGYEGELSAKEFYEAFIGELNYELENSVDMGVRSLTDKGYLSTRDREREQQARDDADYRAYKKITGGDYALERSRYNADRALLYGKVLDSLGFNSDVDFSKLAEAELVNQFNASELAKKFDLKYSSAEQIKNLNIGPYGNLTYEVGGDGSNSDFSGQGRSWEQMMTDAEEAAKKNVAGEYLKKQLQEVKKGFTDLAGDTLWKGLVTPFETIGSSMLQIIDGTKTWEDALKDAGSAMQTIAGDMIKQTGTLAQNAGLALIQSGAMSQNWAMVAGGIALAAAGGFVSGLGSSISNYNKDNEDTDEAAKLQSLTDQLKELLAQARADALYYEKNLQHKTALGINERFSYQSVNDAVIAPGGKVITTSPEDYLIATKTPQALGSTIGNAMQPKINFQIINNAGVDVRQEQRENADGSIDIIAVIENKMAEYIASSKSDDAFNARQYRLNGRAGIM